MFDTFKCTNDLYTLIFAVLLKQKNMKSKQKNIARLQIKRNVT